MGGRHRSRTVGKTPHRIDQCWDPCVSVERFAMRRDPIKPRSPCNVNFVIGLWVTRVPGHLLNSGGTQERTFCPACQTNSSSALQIAVDGYLNIKGHKDMAARQGATFSRSYRPVRFALPMRLHASDSWHASRSILVIIEQRENVIKLKA